MRSAPVCMIQPTDPEMPAKARPRRETPTLAELPARLRSLGADSALSAGSWVDLLCDACAADLEHAGLLPSAARAHVARLRTAALVISEHLSVVRCRTAPGAIRARIVEALHGAMPTVGRTAMLSEVFAPHERQLVRSIVEQDERYVFTRLRPLTVQRVAE